MSATSQGTVTLPLIIATDGSIRGPHKGTWGWVRQDGSYAVGSSNLPRLSSTVVELVAILEALHATPVGASVHLRSDSRSALQYLVGAAAVTGVEPTSGNTLRRSLTREGAVDLLAIARAVRDLCRERDVTTHWVKGHADDALNIRVDEFIAAVQDGKVPAGSAIRRARLVAPHGPCDTCGASVPAITYQSITASEYVTRLAALHDVIDSAPQARFATHGAPRIDLVCAGAFDLSGVWAWFRTDGAYAVGAMRRRFDTADPAAPYRASLVALAEAIAATPIGASVHISARSAAIRSLAHILTVTTSAEPETLPPAVRRGLREQLDHVRDLCSERAVTLHELHPGMPGAAAISRLLADGAAASLRKRSIYVQAYVASFKQDRVRRDGASHCECGVRTGAASKPTAQPASEPGPVAAPRRLRAPAARPLSTPALSTPGALPETYAALDRIALAAAGGGVLR